MKKSLGIAVVAVFLFSPILAMADYLGTAQLKVYWSSPISYNGYYLDYDGDLKIDGEEKSSLVEIFCVENQDASDYSERYTLYSIENSLIDFNLDPNKYKRAAWIADNYTMIADAVNYSGSPDMAKGEAQKAIWSWEVTDVMNIVDNWGLDRSILNILPDDSALATYNFSGWMLAVNKDHQDYLVPTGAPVPEPATMLLLGTGLIGLAGLGRKRLKKSA